MTVGAEMDLLILVGRVVTVTEKTEEDERKEMEYVFCFWLTFVIS